jgi:hypothetical protein
VYEIFEEFGYFDLIVQETSKRSLTDQEILQLLNSLVIIGTNCIK